VEHLVKFQTAEGREGQHTAASLDDALRFVERLRNNEGANEVRVFRMHEIPIEFKTYFKVEVGASDEAVVEPAPEAAEGAEGSRPALVATASGTAADAEGDASARRLFSRG
jgi:hypothetical protein